MKETGKARFSAPPQAAWRRVDDEIVILDLNTSVYYSLDEVGARMWELLLDGLAPDEVAGRICDEYDAAPARARADLDELVALLRRESLLVPA